MEKARERGKIRKFRKKDAEVCSKIIAETLKDATQLTEKEQEHIRNQTTPKELIKRMKKREHFIYERNKKIIGTSVLNKNEIRNMYVSPKFQNKGVGSLILKKIEEEAKKKNIKKLFA